MSGVTICEATSSAKADGHAGGLQVYPSDLFQPAQLPIELRQAAGQLRRFGFKAPVSQPVFVRHARMPRPTSCNSAAPPASLPFCDETLPSSSMCTSAWSGGLISTFGHGSWVGRRACGHVWPRPGLRCARGADNGFPCAQQLFVDVAEGADSPAQGGHPPSGVWAAQPPCRCHCDHLIRGIGQLGCWAASAGWTASAGLRVRSSPGLP